MSSLGSCAVDQSDRITLEGMTFFGHHGVHPEERTLGQRFVVDAILYRDLRAAGESDDLAATTNYADVYRAVEQVVTGEPSRLIEHVAETIARVVLRDQAVAAVTVRVRKPWAPIPGSVLESVAVEITRRRESQQ